MTFWAANNVCLLDTARSSGGGSEELSDNFRSASTAIFFPALFLCACYISLRFVLCCLVDNTIGLLAYSIPMTAAKFGPILGHVVFNGYGIFLARYVLCFEPQGSVEMV